MEASTFSASFGWSQKCGPMVISCSACSASSLASMSKMPPQGSYSIPQVLDLFFSHLAKIKKEPGLNRLSGFTRYVLNRHNYPVNPLNLFNPGSDNKKRPAFRQALYEVVKIFFEFMLLPVVSGWILHGYRLVFV